jgi:hypothetical protein
VESPYHAGSSGESGVLAMGATLEHDCFRLDVNLNFDPLPTLFWEWINRRELEASLSAVIESSTGEISYWALKHAGAKPDFHDPASFVLPLQRS